jgi:hypothetical protein
MERLYPVRRKRPVNLDLPEIHTADDISAVFRTVMQALARGEVTTDQVERVTKLLEFGRKSIEMEELARCLAEMRVELQELKENYERRAA